MSVKVERMFGMFKKVTLEQGPKITRIEGVNFLRLGYDIERHYGSSVVTKYMFRKGGSTALVLDNFFLLELHIVLKELLKNRNLYSDRKVLSEVITLLEEKSWIRSTVNPSGGTLDVGRLSKVFKLAPFESQKTFLLSYLRIKTSYCLNGLLLDAKAGSGKSLNSLMWSELLNQGKTIVVCPSSVIYKVWVNDIKEKYFKQGRTCWVFQEGKPLDTTADYFIFHNDCLRNNNWEYIQQLISEIKKASVKQQIKLIVDECHNFNETSSQQCQVLIQLCDYAKFTDILFMSGTPLKAIGKEAYTLFCCIDPWFSGNARDRFLDAYGRSREKLNGLLANRLGRNRFVIESLDGMPEEPEIEKILVKFPGCEKYTLKALRMDMITYTTERVKFYEKHMDDYIIMFTNFIDDYERSLRGNAKDMAELTQYKKTVNYFRTHGYNSFVDNDKSKFCKEVEVKIEARLKGDDLKNFRNIKSAVKYVGLKIKGEVLGRVIGGARSKATYDLFMHANLPELMQRAEKKTLIYTSYVDVVKGCAEYMTKLGYKPTYVFGENSKDRDRLIQEFGAKKEIDPLITTFDSLKEGYPLIMANLLIMLNAPFRDYEVKQTKARIFRTGQDSPCFFLLLELDTGDEVNISSRSINILEWSKDQVEQLLSQSNFSNGEILNVGGLESYDAIDDYDHGDVLWPKRSSTVLDLF